jgi:hypothetical protein
MAVLRRMFRVDLKADSRHHLVMAENASPDGFDRMAGNVLDELQAQNAIRQLGLSEQVLEQLAEA